MGAWELQLVRAVQAAISLPDPLLRVLDGRPLLKMGPLVLAVVYLWGRPWASERRRWEFVARGLLGITAAMAVARAMQELLPARARPFVASPDLLRAQALGQPGAPAQPDEDPLADFSSFPSDHAILAFALATVAWAGHRGLGAVAALWAATVVCLPRLYAGLHYASDLLAGALIGAAVAAAALRAPMPTRAAARLGCLAERHAGLAWAVVFLFCYEAVVLFVDVRAALRLASHLFQAASGAAASGVTPPP
jgi:undecaprenyl-diphosphatase